MNLFIDGISFKGTRFDVEYMTRLAQDGLILKTDRNSFETFDCSDITSSLLSSDASIETKLKTCVEKYTEEIKHHSCLGEIPFTYALYLFSVICNPKLKDEVKERTNKIFKKVVLTNVRTRPVEDTARLAQSGETCFDGLHEAPRDHVRINDRATSLDCQANSEKPNPSGKTFTKTRQRRIKKEKYTEIDLSNAEKWREMALKHCSWSDPVKTKRFNVLRFAEAISKIKKDCNMTDSGIEALIDFIDGDEFWKSNALSPINLFKKSKNDLRKIDNILLAMKKRYNKNEKFARAANAVANRSWDNPFE